MENGREDEAEDENEDESREQKQMKRIEIFYVRERTDYVISLQQCFYLEDLFTTKQATREEPPCWLSSTALKTIFLSN